MNTITSCEVLNYQGNYILCIQIEGYLDDELIEPCVQEVINSGMPFSGLTFVYASEWKEWDGFIDGNVVWLEEPTVEKAMVKLLKHLEDAKTES